MIMMATITRVITPPEREDTVYYPRRLKLGSSLWKKSQDLRVFEIVIFDHLVALDLGLVPAISI